MEAGRKVGSLEFIIILIIIFLVAIAGWFGWYVPARNKITVGIYKIAMNGARNAAEICIQSNGKIIPGKSGDPVCVPNNSGTYPVMPSDCGSAIPHFKIIFSQNGKWSLAAYDNGGNLWDCLGCRAECVADKCDYIGECY